MAKRPLHTHLATSQEVKGQVLAILSETEKQFKTDGSSSPYSGIDKSYTPVDEKEGLKIEPEHKEINTTVPARLGFTLGMFEKLFDWTVTRDEANTRAFADVELNGEVILTKVPVDTLIEGQKVLIQLRELLKKTPTLDMSYIWSKSDRPDVYKRGPVITYKKDKKTRAVTMAKATEKFAEVFEKVVEDVVAGEWSTTYYSGAITPSQKHALLNECEDLLKAFKEAQTRANEVEIVPRQIGNVLTGRLKAALSK